MGLGLGLVPVNSVIRSHSGHTCDDRQSHDNEDDDDDDTIDDMFYDYSNSSEGKILRTY